MKKVQWTFDSEAENNLKLVCVRLNENVPFHESFSRLSIVQTLRDLPSAFGLTKKLDSSNSCSKVINRSPFMVVYLTATSLYATSLSRKCDYRCTHSVRLLQVRYVERRFGQALRGVRERCKQLVEQEVAGGYSF